MPSALTPPWEANSVWSIALRSRNDRGPVNGRVAVSMPLLEGGGVVIKIVELIVVGIRIIIWLSWADRLKAGQSNTSTQEPEWDLTQG